MKDKIAKYSVKNLETGEKFAGEFFFFTTGFEMTTIVLVKAVEIYGPHPNGAIQIEASCKALDSLGWVYNLRVSFEKRTHEEEEALLKDIKADSVYIFRGAYGIVENDSIYMYDPDYRSVEPDFNENEVREAFRMNERATD